MVAQTQETNFDFSQVFQSSFVPIWIENIDPLYRQFAVLRESGVENLRSYLEEFPHQIPNLATKIEVVDVNEATITMYKAKNRQELLGKLGHLMATIETETFVDALVSFWNQDDVISMETTHYSLDNEPLEVIISARIPRFDSENLVIPVTVTNVTALREKQRALAAALREKSLLAEELQKAAEEIKTLKGIIPICASCKMVRDDRGYWNQIEKFISDRTNAKFTHGICPDCSQRLYPKDEES